MNAAGRSLCALVVALAASGCVVTEKKTLVIVVPPDSNDVHLCYAFEGISVLDHKESSLARARTDLDGLRKDDFGFFVPGGTGLDGPLLKHCRFEPVQFFTDAGRKRSLCAVRRMSIRDRDEFARVLNQKLSETLAASFRPDAKEVLADVKRVSEDLKTEKVRKDAADLGVGPLLKSAEGVLDLAADFDLESIGKLKAATEDGFRWVRFEPDAIRFVIPATAERARKIAADPKAKDWVKEMRTFVEPIELEAADDGLAVVLGKKGQAIRLTYADPRPHRPDDEGALTRHAAPKELRVGDRPATADRLIEQFVAEKTKKR
jgi:hypothetical protein